MFLSFLFKVITIMRTCYKNDCESLFERNLSWTDTHCHCYFKVHVCAYKIFLANMEMAYFNSSSDSLFLLRCPLNSDLRLQNLNFLNHENFSCHYIIMNTEIFLKINSLCLPNISFNHITLVLSTFF